MVPRKAITLPLCCLCLVVRIVGALVEQPRHQVENRSRRRFFLSSILSATPTTAASVLLLPHPAIAARGAAELDLEYYARDLFGGNRREGNVEASRAPPLAPPRILQEPLLSFLLSEDASCIPKRVLISMLQESTDQTSMIDCERLVQDRFLDYCVKAAKAFYSRAPYADESLSNQYYFDLSAYALWRTAGDLLPNLLDRDAFVRQVGRDLYHGLLSNKMIDAIKSTDAQLFKISRKTTELRKLLQVFQTNGFIKSYRLSGAADSSSDVISADSNIFDDLDDQALAQGASVDFLLSLMEPATLGASLQITAEQSRFAPDYVGPAVAALLETVSLKCTWETYFVDNEYRPNSKDYFPNEQLIQFSVKKRNVS